MSKIQFWIMRGDDRVRFPVNPETISVSSPFGYEDIEIASFGETTVIGERKQREFQFSSFFPRDYSPIYCEYADIPPPQDIVNTVEKLRSNRKPVRFIITGTDVSYRCTIREFSYEPERAGSPGDIYFTITLKEHRDREVRVIKENKVAAKPKRPASKPPAPKTYTVKSGDCLWKIAARFYGSGAKWRTIYNANKKVVGKNPNLIYPGQKLVIPNE
jgi:nucleoid-associated protein YgaU